MRLICPNCGAQYEVDDQVIPDDGRDVQCSNCGHTWFQQPAHLDRDLAEELDRDLPESGEPPGSDPAGPAARGESAPARRGLDPEVTDVLREEAKREASARRAEQAGIESQPDLGLDEADRHAADRSAAARARMARLRGLDEASPEDAAAAAAVAATGSRRDLLPDIEEINSTLRASQDRDASDPAAPEPELVEEPSADKALHRRGFRLGFGLAVLMVAGAAIVYAMAPQIARAVPQSEPYMIRYVDWANETRTTADNALDRAVSRISLLVAGLSGGE